MTSDTELGRESPRNFISSISEKIDPNSLAIIGLAAAFFGGYVIGNPYVCIAGVTAVVSAPMLAKDRSRKHK
ncbi:MAG: hypothetical protein ACOX50_00710 [Patescibacteria group bacterium]|jgi:hypothetical protein